MNAVAGDPPTHLALDRFLRSLAARDASPHTIRAYDTAIGAYLDWLAERGVDWTRPTRPELRGYLAKLGSGGASSTVAQRLAAIRSFHPQLLVDAHEMGAHDTFLFYPATDPFTPHFPQMAKTWWQRFGRPSTRLRAGPGRAMPRQAL